MLFNREHDSSSLVSSVTSSVTASVICKVTDEANVDETSRTLNTIIIVFTYLIVPEFKLMTVLFYLFFFFFFGIERVLFIKEISRLEFC